jgi:fermentation-respiration switch protein FrsA (DUF1100 family)
MLYWLLVFPVFVYLCLSFALGTFVAFKFLLHIRYSTKHTLEHGFTSGEITPEFMKRERFSFKVPSPQGESLAGVYWKGNARKTIIFSHGVSWTWHGMVKYMEPYLQQGWNVVAYDHRAHGESGGRLVTFGNFEKHDLVAVVKWALSTFPDTELWGVHGESMGAAVMLQSAPLLPEIDFFVSDSSFSDIANLVSAQAKALKVPRFLIPFALLSADAWSLLLAKFRLSRISPLAAIANDPRPMLFIHGKDDALVPFSMAEALQKTNKGTSVKALHIQEKAVHAQSILVDRLAYEKVLQGFLAQVEKNQT